MRLSRISRAGLATAVAALALAFVLAGCSGPAGRAASSDRGGPASYYLALGDSLSQGVQPDAAGTSVETGQGYPSQVYQVLRRTRPGLRLVTLGCPGETTATMMNGGLCRYPGGSQLADALGFLRAHRGHVLLITVDIGANDVQDCGGKPGPTQIVSCFGDDFRAAPAGLAVILARLRAAAGSGPRIVGMNYYLPELAQWREGLMGRAIAWGAERLAAGYNDLLDKAYTADGARVANVFGAFDTADFTQVAVPGTGTLPRNVARICQWTWECAAPPRGPNEHANQAGYHVIADVILRACGLT